MTKYTIVIEDAGPDFCPYILGLDGCISTGKTVDDVTNNMRDALKFHLEGMRLHGDKLPEQMPIVKTAQVA